MARSKETEHSCLGEEIVIDQYDDVLSELVSWECRCPECFRLSLGHAYLGSGLDGAESGESFSSTLCLISE
jgi:hypothetical protein